MDLCGAKILNHISATAISSRKQKLFNFTASLAARKLAFLVLILNVKYVLNYGTFRLHTKGIHLWLLLKQPGDVMP